MAKVTVEENGQTEAKLDGEFVLAATFEKIEGGAQILIAGVGGIQPKDFMIMLGQIVVEVTKRHLEDPKLRELTYIYLLEKVTEVLKKDSSGREENEMRTDAFIPENANEETLMLQGRINALAAVLAYTKGEAISKELVKAIVGIEPEEDV